MVCFALCFRIIYFLPDWRDPFAHIQVSRFDGTGSIMWVPVKKLWKIWVNSIGTQTTTNHNKARRLCVIRRVYCMARVAWLSVFVASVVNIRLPWDEFYNYCRGISRHFLYYMDATTLPRRDEQCISRIMRYLRDIMIMISEESEALVLLTKQQYCLKQPKMYVTHGVNYHGFLWGFIAIWIQTETI